MFLIGGGGVFGCGGGGPGVGGRGGGSGGGGGGGGGGGRVPAHAHVRPVQAGGHQVRVVAHGVGQHHAHTAIVLLSAALAACYLVLHWRAAELYLKLPSGVMESQMLWMVKVLKDLRMITESTVQCSAVQCSVL